jgi:hypothetical protein
MVAAGVLVAAAKAIARSGNRREDARSHRIGGGVEAKRACVVSKGVSWTGGQPPKTWKVEIAGRCVLECGRIRTQHVSDVVLGR